MSLIDIGSGGNSNIKRTRIILDVGHGGNDPGAVGIAGLSERNTVMRIAEIMTHLQPPNFQFLLTRHSNDERPSIPERTEMVREGRADMFISLHCNGFVNPQANGSEVFFWTKNSEGKRLAQFILSDILHATGWRNRGVKTNGSFGVLRLSRQIPSCLIEYNFITNPAIEQQLRDDQFLRTLAIATIEGIQRYLATFKRTV